MKILLVGEASGIHQNLKKGLIEHGCNCKIVFLQSAHIQGRQSDLYMSEAGSSILQKVKRNITPLLKVVNLESYEVINFINTITTQPGRYVRYLDLPILRKKTNLISYYALSCDELGLIKEHIIPLPYKPCKTCWNQDIPLGVDCKKVISPNHKKGVMLAQKYFDCGFSSMIEYDHASKAFTGKKFQRIQFPINIAQIEFHPASNQRVTKIVHTPTKRGFKGTSLICQAIEILSTIRNDFEFKIIEGLHYDKYLKTVKEADIIIDQVFSQSPGVNALEMLAMGKIVFSGSTGLGRSYFEFMKNLPVIDASPNPENLVKDLNQILDRKHEYKELALCGREYVKTHHDPVKVAGLFLEAWRSVGGLL